MSSRFVTHFQTDWYVAVRREVETKFRAIPTDASRQPESAPSVGQRHVPPAVVRVSGKKPTVPFSVQTADVHRPTHWIDQILASRIPLDLPLNGSTCGDHRRCSNAAGRLISVIWRIVFFVSDVHDQDSYHVVSTRLKYAGRKGESIGSARLRTKQGSIQPNRVNAFTTTFPINGNSRLISGRNKVSTVPNISVVKPVIVFVKNRQATRRIRVIGGRVIGNRPIGVVKDRVALR